MHIVIVIAQIWFNSSYLLTIFKKMKLKKMQFSHNIFAAEFIAFYTQMISWLLFRQYVFVISNCELIVILT